MRVFRPAVVLLFVLIFTVAGDADAQTAGGRIAYVDLSRLFDEYHKTKEYDTVLEAEHRAYEQESKAKIEKIREAQGKLALLTDDKRAALEKEIETMKSDLMEFDRQKKTDLTKERNEKIREILLEIEKIVSDFAEKEHYAIILNDRVLIYGDPAANVTENVLKVLNAEKK